MVILQGKDGGQRVFVGESDVVTGQEVGDEVHPSRSFDSRLLF